MMYNYVIQKKNLKNTKEIQKIKTLLFKLNKRVLFLGEFMEKRKLSEEEKKKKEKKEKEKLRAIREQEKQKYYAYYDDVKTFARDNGEW